MGNRRSALDVIHVVLIVFAFLAAAFLGALLAQEKVTLSAPAFQDPGATEFRVASLYLNRQAHEIRAMFGEVVPGTAIFKANGRTLTCSYADDAADSLLLALNRMNFSTVSLERRVMVQCQSDGKLGAGTITGVPQ